MQFGILGPLELRTAGVPVRLGGEKPRVVLACLLLQRNRVVPADRLIEWVWGDKPPRTAANVLQAHIGAIRKALATADPRAGSVLETRLPGYILHVEPDDLDAAVFERLVHANVDGTSEAGAAELSLQQALSLWRGNVLDGIDVPLDLRGEAARLEELRVVATEQLLQIRVDRGDIGRAVSELEEFVAAYPLRERSLGLLMLALYRQGRQADALAVYQRGRRRLIDELGLDPGLELVRLEQAILQHDPGLDRSADDRGHTPASDQARPHNLPIELTSFIGRAAQLAAVRQLLDDGHRLVTITGAGGAGKTRFARRVAADVLDRFPDGVWLVDLTAVLSGDRIIDAVASAIGVHEQPGRPIFESTVGLLRDCRALIVFDNCEPLIWHCARLCEALLASCSGVAILASSRDPMRVSSETVWPLPPLSNDDESVRLFLERGQAASPNRVLTDDNRAVVEAIVARLDGLPLAIEMAAARLRSLSPTEILARLDDRLRLLTLGSRTAAPRHQTLRATMDWSHDLLRENEQVLWRRLSVFAGTVGIEDIEAVVAGGPLESADIGDVIGELVDRSLVTVSEPTTGQTRYGLLDTVKEYGRVKLRECGDEPTMLRRHFDWCAELARDVHAVYLGREGEAVGRIATVLDEMRAALVRGPAIDPSETLGLAGTLGWFWLASGRLAEGRQHCTSALNCAGRDVDRARVLTAVGRIVVMLGDNDQAIAPLEAALDTWRALDDRREQCMALDALGWGYFWTHHNDAALGAFQQGVVLAHELDERELVRHHMIGECQILIAIGDVERARPLAEELIDTTPSDDLHSSHFAHHFLADCGLLAGECALAAREYASALVMARAMEDPVETTIEMEGLAMAQAGLGRTRQALTLGGAAEASFEALDVNVEVPFWTALRHRWLEQTRAEAGNDGDRWWHDGRQLNLDDALLLAAQLPSD